jgi:LysM repeat protein
MTNGIGGLGSGGSPQVPAVQDDPFLIAQQYTVPQVAPILDNPSATPTEGQSTSAPNGGYTNERSFQNSTFNGVMERRGLGSGEIVEEDNNNSQGTGNTPIGGTPSNGGGSSSSQTQNSTSPPASPVSANATLQGRDPDLIYVGEKIKLPDGSTYTVKDGDTLSGIARDHGVTLAKLMELNGFNPQLRDEYVNGRLVKAHHIGDQMMPGSPGSATTTQTTGTPQTAQVPGTGSATQTETDPNKPNFPAKTLLEKLGEFIGPIANKDQIKEILEKVLRHQTDRAQPEVSAQEIAILNAFMVSYGNAMLQAEPAVVTTPTPTPSEPEPAPTTISPQQPLLGDPGVA